VDEFHRTWVTLFEINPRNTAVINLTKEFTEVSASLMPHPCFWKESRFVTCLDNPVGKVDVFAKSHFREPAKFQVDITSDTHVE
jgi:hypothetical protein